MSKSKNHHYLPQWLMKQWADENGRVICVDRRDAPLIRNFVTHVRNVNSENHLYTTEELDGSKHDNLEVDVYSSLDMATKNLTDSLYRSLGNRQIPNMGFRARRLLWQFFLYNQYKRMPRFSNDTLENLNYEEIKKRTIQEAVDEGEDKSAILLASRSFNFESYMAKRGIQYIRANQDIGTLDRFAKWGIEFEVAPDGTNFILPDQPNHIPKYGIRIQKQDYVIPIHPKYALKGIKSDPSITLVDLNKSEVRRRNELWYANANRIISVSERQVISLVKRHDRQKICF